MFNSDFHIHTCFCDGKNSPEEIVIEAISRGMKKIGFSGHSYMDFENFGMSPEILEKYKLEINRLKQKYKAQIKILLGIEYDYFSDLDISDYDYVIGSVHYIECNGEKIAVDHSVQCFEDAIRKCNNDVYELCEKYFALVSNVVDRTNANIIGHFDLVSKFNDGNKFFDENNERYINAYTKALDILLKTGKHFEINTGAMSRGYKSFPYPSMNILKYIAEHNGKVILSSDSHQKETIMYKFEESEKIANSLGLEIVEL